MRPEQLKNSILQLAIQGKLVEQRKEEGTGEELFKEIQKEKKKLLEEGKIKKQKTLPEIREDEIPFDIPETWKWVRASDILYITMGQSPKGENINNNKLGYEFHQGKSNFSEMFLNKSKVFTTADNKVIEAPAIVMSVRAPVGDVNLVKNKIYIGRGLASFQIYTECDLLYIYYYFLTIKNSLERVSTGSTFKAINSEIVNKIIIPLPPLEEQKRIVEKIEEILPLVKKYEKSWTRLEELNKKFPLDMKKSILDEAIKGKLVEQRKEEGTGEELYKEIQKEKKKFLEEGKIKKQKTLPEISEDEIPFDIPDNWKWVRLGEISQFVQYGYSAPAQIKGRIKMVRISDIQDESVCWDKVPYCDIREEEIEQYLLKNNDILFARTGGTVGKSFLVKNIGENAIYAGYLIRMRYGKNIVPQFLKYFMGSALYWAQLRNGTIATAQPNCNGQTLSKMMLPLPPLAEQKRIVEKIEELLPLCDELK
jgi:hypothetical protein